MTVYTPPATQTTGDLITTALWNAEVVDNMIVQNVCGFEVVLDSGGAVLSTDLMLQIPYMPYSFNFTAVTLKGKEASGSVVVDIYKPTASSNTPADSDSITSAATPTISATNYHRDASLTGWTKAVTKGDCLAFRVESVTTFTRVYVMVEGVRT
jgi:hypothetical protein